MRNIMITGAASGIGLAIAHSFAALGDSLTLVDVDEEKLQVAAAGSASAGAPDTCTFVADLRDADACARMFEAAWGRRPVDVLVNAAGIYPSIPLLECDAALWDSVQHINVRAPMLLMTALAKAAIAAARRPSVVNISSTAANRTRRGAAPYCVSKASIDILTKAAALEFGQHGIRVNAVAPGFIAVNSTVNRVTDDYAAAVSVNPLGRPGTPADVAAAVCWLASDAASWITGSVLTVDGGSSTGSVATPLSWP